MTALNEWLQRACGPVLFLALIAGCEGETDGDGQAGPVAANDFSSNFAATYCSAIQGCCSQFGENFTLATCQESLRGYLTAAFSTQLANPRIHFDEQVAGRCIDAYSAALIGCTNESLFDDAQSACTGLLVGTVALGGACGESDECQESVGQYVSCEMGVCVQEDVSSLFDAPRGKLGEACFATCATEASGGGCISSASSTPDSRTCWADDGLYCAADGTCQPAPQTGEPCQQYTCAAGSYCSGSICQPATADGPCPGGAGCLATSYCDYSVSQCVPRKADGQACDSAEECLGGDCELDRCRAWSVASVGACAGLLDD